VVQLPHPPRPPTPNSESASHPQNPITLPPPPEAISTTPLLGTPPNATLHALYTSQIATLIWWTLQETGSARRPVVVGLTLAKSTRGNTANEGHDEEDEVSEGERERFLGVMDMVISWPGPGE
jgi:proteasome assembly chaperone 3